MSRKSGPQSVCAVPKSTTRGADCLVEGVASIAIVKSGFCWRFSRGNRRLWFLGSVSVCGFGGRSRRSSSPRTLC